MSELYALPEGWEWKKLDNIVKLQNGFAFKSKLFTNTGLPIVRIKNIKNERVILNDVVYFNPKDYSKSLDRYQIKKNDLLIAMSGATTGKIGLYDREEKSYLNQRVGLFRIENFDLRSYLFYFLSTQIEKNLAQSLGAAQPNLSTQQINDMAIPLPPLQEQKRIVAKLDSLFERIDCAIALHQQNIDEVEGLMGSALDAVFGELEEEYEKESFESISSNIRYGYTDKAQESGNAVFIRITDIDENGKFKNNFVYVNVDEINLNRYRLDKYDLLVARSGATAGKVALFDLDDIAVFASYLIRIKPDLSIVDPSFLFYFCYSPKYWDQLNTIKVGGAQPNVNATNLKQIVLPLPPLPIQQKTVRYLDALSQKVVHLKEVQQEKMEQLKALKASILDRAFRGEL